MIDVAVDVTIGLLRGGGWVDGGRAQREWAKREQVGGEGGGVGQEMGTSGDRSQGSENATVRAG